MKTTMIRRLPAAVALCLATGGIAIAASAPVVPVPPAAAQPAPHAASNVLEEGITKLNLFIASGQARDPAALTRFVDETIKPFFDFERMAALAAGPTWQQMNDEQKARFRQRIEQMFLNAFIRNVVSHRGPPPLVQFLPPRPSRDASRIDLLARLLLPKQKPRRLVFRFAKSGDKWRVFDVSVDGKSAVLYYRSHFMKLAREGGIPAMLR